jgi:hypothetical protein
MLNADKLTIDAQSALRRCIELFSHNTRFFIIVEDKYKLLKPVLSRFCEIYIPDPVHLGRQINLHKYNIDQLFKKNAQTTDWLKKTILADTHDLIDETKTDKLSIVLRDISAKIYEKGYSALDIMALIEQPTFLPDLDLVKRYELLFAFNKIKKEFRNEKLLIMFVLNFVFISSNVSLENISFM